MEQKQYFDNTGEDCRERYVWLDSVRKVTVKSHLNRKMMNIRADCLPNALARRMSKQLTASLEGRTLSEVRGRLGQPRDPYLQSLVRSLNALMAMEHIVCDQVLGRQEAFACSWQLLRLLTKEWCEPLVKSHIDNIRRGEQRTCNALVKRLTRLRQQHGKLMVVRIDIWYGKVYANDMAPQERLFQDWEELKTFLNTKFASSFLGYATKVEYGVKKGVHMHVLLVFNGSVVRQDVTIARLLGEHWRDVITQGAGGYFNCNTPAYKGRFLHCGVGVFSSLDEACKAGLEALANYMAKVDFLVRMVMPDRGKFFSCVFRDVTLKDSDMQPLE